MKIRKSVLQAVAVGTFVGIVATSCQQLKEEMKVENALEKMHLKKEEPTPPGYDCPACGMG